MIPERRRMSADVLMASRREKVCLSTLQSKMNTDPEGFMSELITLYSHFCSSLHLFQQQPAAFKLSSIVVNELGETALFLAHVTPLYPTHLSDFPLKLTDLLRCSARSLPSSLRRHLAQALILLIRKKVVEIGDTLALFMELQSLGDKNLRKLAFEHVVQNTLFSMLQGEDESIAKRSLIVLCDLHRRRVWFDDRTANAICTACFHSSSRIRIAALAVLLGYDLPEQVEDTDASNRESVYQVVHKGTIASKKKKKRAKLQRAIQSLLKREQHATSEKNTPNHYSPLNQLKDAQDFAEKLFSHLQDCNEQFEVKMMMLKVIARTVGLHRLILLNFYPFLQTYVKSHQCDITKVLAVAAQACHSMVPPDAVEPLFRQVLDQFLHARCCTEAITVGLNVVELCLRIPLLMTEDLLQELVLYKKSHEKAISTGARSLITLFQELCPSLRVKKYCGRLNKPKAQPKAVGEVNVSSDMSDLALLDNEDGDNNDDNESTFSIIGNEGKNDGDKQFQLSEKENGDEDDNKNDIGGDHIDDKDEEEFDGMNDDDDVDECDEHADEEQELKIVKSNKRKVIDYNGQLNAADTSFRAVKRLTESKKQYESPDLTDGILSNEGFRQIIDLKAKKEAKPALAQHGLLRKGSEAKSTKLKIPCSDQLTATKVDPAELELLVKYLCAIAMEVQIEHGITMTSQKEREKFYDIMKSVVVGIFCQETSNVARFGAGIYVNIEGYILVPYRLVHPNIFTSCQARNILGEYKDLKLIETNEELDLALVKAVDEDDNEKKYNHVKFGEASDIKIGTNVIMIGHIYYCQHTTYIGRISSPKLRLFHEVPISDNKRRNYYLEKISPQMRLFQTDNLCGTPHCMGAPVFNRYGKMLGMYSFAAIKGQEYVVPIDVINDFVTRAIEKTRLSKGEGSHRKNITTKKGKQKVIA